MVEDEGAFVGVSEASLLEIVAATILKGMQHRTQQGHL